MSSLLVLPTPIASHAISLGQLITDPLFGESASFKPATTPAHKELHAQSKYEDTIAHDESGRFTSTQFVSRLSGQAHAAHENLLLLTAEHMSYAIIEKPAVIFDRLHEEKSAQSFLRAMAVQNKPVYFVTAVQVVKEPSFKRAVSQHDSVAEAKSPRFRLPVRRVDSASSLEKGNAEQLDHFVLAVELMKVKCHVGAANEPHCIEDLQYHWNYNSCDQDGYLQLSTGLGKPMQASELQNLIGVANDDDDASYESDSSSYSYSDDGIGGFPSI